MTIRNEQDMCALAADLEALAVALRTNGMRAIATTEGWEDGPRSPVLDPSTRSTPVDLDGENTPPMHADPTGEAAMVRDSYVAGAHELLRSLLRLLEDSVPEALRLVRSACPDVGSLRLRPEEMTPVQISAAGWCTSCFRDGGHREPITTRANGQRRYRDHCNWCGEFMAAHDGRVPPLALLERRHRVKRISAKDVTEALAAEDAERAEERAQAKADRKKNRRKKK